MEELFGKDRQDDAMKLLLHVFEELKNELTNENVRFRSRDYKNWEDAWNGYKAKFTSIIDELFMGMYQKNVKCQACKNINKIFENYSYTWLNLETDDLLSAYENYISEKTVYEAGSIRCKNCKKKSEIVITKEMVKLPKYCIFLFNRYNSENDGKNNKFIKYPKNLTLSQKLINDSDTLNKNENTKADESTSKASKEQKQEEDKSQTTSKILEDKAKSVKEKSIIAPETNYANYNKDSDQFKNDEGLQNKCGVHKINELEAENFESKEKNEVLEKSQPGINESAIEKAKTTNPQVLNCEEVKDMLYKIVKKTKTSRKKSIQSISYKESLEDIKPISKSINWIDQDLWCFTMIDWDKKYFILTRLIKQRIINPIMNLKTQIRIKMNLNLRILVVDLNQMDWMKFNKYNKKSIWPKIAWSWKTYRSIIKSKWV